MQSVLRLHSNSDTIINEYGVVGRVEIGRRNQSAWRKSTPGSFVHHKSHTTRPGTEPGLPNLEAGN
jgi:hypothetical protein